MSRSIEDVQSPVSYLLLIFQLPTWINDLNRPITLLWVCLYCDGRRLWHDTSAIAFFVTWNGNIRVRICTSVYTVRKLIDFCKPITLEKPYCRCRVWWIAVVSEFMIFYTSLILCRLYGQHFFVLSRVTSWLSGFKGKAWLINRVINRRNASKSMANGFQQRRPHKSYRNLQNIPFEQNIFLVTTTTTTVHSWLTKM